jgi:hypothetical protein
VDALVWDTGNLAHLQERNAERRAAGQREISREEVDALYDSADYITQDVEYLTRAGEWEPQVHLVGRTPRGRFLTVVCQVAHSGQFRPVTVWESDDRELGRYWGENEDDGTA